MVTPIKDSFRLLVTLPDNLAFWPPSQVDRMEWDYIWTLAKHKSLPSRANRDAACETLPKSLQHSPDPKNRPPDM